MRTVSVLGVGRLGGALAIALSRAGYELEQLIYRSVVPSPATISAIHGRPLLVAFDELQAVSSDILVIATGDDCIEEASAAAARVMRHEAVMLHLSGALSSEVLSAASDFGIAAGSMHPLISISDAVRGSEAFSNAYFCIEGSEKAVSAAEGLVQSLGARAFSISPECKPLYHAAAVLASGHVISLFEAAVEALSECGLERGQAKDVLFPLVASSVANLSFQDTAVALTGPFSRGDEAAVRRHLNAFEEAELTDIERIYIDIGSKSLDLAERNGASRVRLERIRQALKLALDKGR